MKTSKKILSMVLTVIMLLSVVPMTDIGLKADALVLGFTTHEDCVDGVIYRGQDHNAARAMGVCSGYCRDDYSVKVHEVKKDIPS